MPDDMREVLDRLETLSVRIGTIESHLGLAPSLRIARPDHSPVPLQPPPIPRIALTPTEPLPARPSITPPIAPTTKSVPAHLKPAHVPATKTASAQSAWSTERLVGGRLYAILG